MRDISPQSDDRIFCSRYSVITQWRDISHYIKVIRQVYVMIDTSRMYNESLVHSTKRNHWLLIEFMVSDTFLVYFVIYSFKQEEIIFTDEI